METKIDEIAERIYRISTLVMEVMPGGFSFNQFLVDADEPLLFHCGLRHLFPLVSTAVAKVIPLPKLRWIGFGHVEADECGAMNEWLSAAPQATVVHGQVGCMVSLNDLADRPPRALADGEALDLGGRRLRMVYTPHVPHAWEAVVLNEETTRTLLCGDVGTNALNDRPLVESGVAEASLRFEGGFPGATALTPMTAPTLRRLAALKPRTLAVMHGASMKGDCAAELHALADGFQKMFERPQA